MDENIISDDVGVVLEEAEIIPCGAEIEAVTEEDNVQYQLCEVDTDDSAVAYRVVQVSDSRTANAELSIATPINNTVQVLTSPINGQFYVLSNGTEVVGSESPKAIAPRVSKIQIEPSPNISNQIIKKRDERRRVTHNEVERRRRDKINTWISKLGKLLPRNKHTAPVTEHVRTAYDSQSKGGILARACDYITELRGVKDKLSQNLDENAQLLEEVKSLRQVVNQLRKENLELKSQASESSNYILGS